MSVNFAGMRKVHPSLCLHAKLFSQWLLGRTVPKNLPFAVSQSGTQVRAVTFSQACGKSDKGSDVAGN